MVEKMQQQIIPMISDRIQHVNWNAVHEDLHHNGYAHISQFLLADECDELRSIYNQRDTYRKTVVMERYRFGLGEYKYFRYPLPPLLQQIRESVYPELVPVANQWMEELNIEKQFPLNHEELLTECRRHGQGEPTPLILKYGSGGFNTLHQDLYGEVYFPIQILLVLSARGHDYTGGEFVLTQQNPRAQSKAIVLTPEKGDMLMFTTNFRPVRSTRGSYRVNMKHGVSEVHSGERFTLGIIFHDAAT